MNSDVASRQFRCPCMDAVEDIDEVRNEDGGFSLEDFSEIRDKCIALREAFLPDSIWSQFRDWHDHPYDAAARRSVLLLAFRRGYLSRVTEPIHRYIASSVGILPTVRKQYQNDLRERWMFADDPHERNKQARIFRGRIVELQFAVWLENRSNKIVGLEANREGPDIEALSPEGVPITYEVKFIGVEDGDFGIFLESMAGLSAAQCVSPYTAMNYLLFRVYEAARQLIRANGSKTVVVVIDDQSWFRFDMQLADNWIDWKSPAFLSQDAAWTQFVTDQKRKYPALPDDLAATLQTIDSVRVFRQTSAFDFLLEFGGSLR